LSVPARAEQKLARAAFDPTLSVNASPTAQSLYLLQQNLPWGHRTDLTGSAALNLNWTVFDGGARRSRVEQAQAHIRGAAGRVDATRDRIEDQVWTAYTNLNTTLRQREASAALLTAATESYGAALESYNDGVRNLLDVTNAQKVLAEARSTEILARTQVLSAVADLAFRTGDAIQVNTRDSSMIANERRRPWKTGLLLAKIMLCTSSSRDPSF
jgi:outer membrane protein